MRSTILEEEHLAPQESAGFWSRITYSFVSPLMILGAQRPLHPADLQPLPRRFNSERHLTIFEKYWSDERLEHPEGPSLFAALRRCFSRRFLQSVGLELLEVLLGFVGPLALKAVIGFTADKSRPVSEGLILVVLLFISSLTKGISAAWTLQITTAVGMDVHSAVVCAVYRKSFRLSKAEKYSRGDIVNMQSNDALRIANIVSALNVLWTAPLTILVSVAMLLQSIGAAALAGLGFMLLLVPLQGMAVGQLETIREEVIGYTDKRISLMSELLNGIRIVKFSTMEGHFRARVMEVRRKELNLLRLQSYWHAVTSFLVFVAPTMTAVVTFVTYAVSGNVLDAQAIFTAMSLFNLLRLPLSFLPVVLFSAVESVVALQRIEDYLLSSEVSPQQTATTNNHNDMNDNNNNNNNNNNNVDLDEEALAGGTMILIEHARFRWGGGSLDDIPSLIVPSLRVNRGQLCMIIGRVGSGKSTLLNAMLGEIDKLTGVVAMDTGVDGRVAYCSQSAWMQNATVRDNILFGNAFFPSQYDDVVRCCALETDLRLLSQGDGTQIGEKGVTLSGGQKQRIAIARAAYSGCDLVLLDDVLSAVDPHVANHIFNKCIVNPELLGRKTRVMVLHQLQFLSHADVVVVVDEGKVTFVGDYPTFATDPSMSDLMETIQPHDEKHGQGHEGGGDDTEVDGTGKEEGKSLTEAEERSTGAISFDVIRRYAEACGASRYHFFGLVVLAEFSQATSDVWLAVWSDHKLQPDPGASFYLGVYVLLGSIVAFLSLLRGVASVEATMQASSRLHYAMLDAILRAPSGFFDITPVGRILTRFSKDMDSLDTSMSDGINSFFTILSLTVGTLLVIVWVMPPFFFVLIPLSWFYYQLMQYYRATSRELARISSTQSSPVYAFFSETLNGTSTIRAYKREAEFCFRNDVLVDSYHKCYWLILSVARWLNVRLEGVGAFIVLFSGLLAAWYRNTMDPGQVGLVLTYGLQMVAALEMIVSGVSSMENQFNAVERALFYALYLPSEAPAVQSVRPPWNWMESGAEIVFQNYCSRYRVDLEDVLRGVTARIMPRQRVGVIGRTGSGKSSTFLALLRMMEAHSGRIVISGIDISSIGLLDLRSKIAIIPQDPVLFSGTVRTNLDPYGEVPDREMYDALERVQLRTYFETHPDGLDHAVTENGENFSLGQRQLLCLARAILRKAKLLLMDEVTASVDIATDRLIQETVRTQFNDCTVLTIAHRLDTILTYDAVMVMDQGRVAEMGSPRELLQNPTGRFTEMLGLKMRDEALNNPAVH
eukprot:PhM_4_TR2069/c0_g1_i1/m.68645/K05665/ABCC1; ATP-binding cassette, subfamily C (CFTR/MRP), member 1